jgi:hypothetical protein
LFLKELQKKEVMAIISKLEELSKHFQLYPKSFLDYPYGLWRFSLESWDRERFFGLLSLEVPAESVLRTYRLQVQLNLKQELEKKLHFEESDLERFRRREERIWLPDCKAVREQLFRDMHMLMKINACGYALSVSIVDADHYCHMLKLSLEQATARGLLLSNEKDQPHRTRVPGAKEANRFYMLKLVDIYRVSRKIRLAEGIKNRLKKRSMSFSDSSFEYMRKFTAEVIETVL